MNLKVKVMIALVLIVGLISIGILKASDSIKQNNNSKELSFDDLQLGNLKLGLLYDDWVKTIKLKPKKIDGNEEDIFIAIEYDNGTNVVITNGRVQTISVTSRLYPTPRGLTVGDTKEKTLKLYGKPKEGDFKDSIWQYSMGDDPANFIVYFKGDKIQSLSVLVQEI